MTTKDILMQETEEIKHKTGIYIPAYRLRDFMSAAEKIVNTITKTFPGISYYEMQIIMKIVQAAIRESKGVQEDDL